MKVVFVCSGNHNTVSPFVTEQMESVHSLGNETALFLIHGKGIKGYLNEVPRFKSFIKEYAPDIIHAHFGLSGLFANLQRTVPVVTTYHGCDINSPQLRLFSLLSVVLSRHNIFVSKSQLSHLKWAKNKCSIIPCGVDLKVFHPKEKAEARRILCFSQEKKYVLFSSSFDRVVKNPQVAKAAISLLPGTELIELKGYSRDEVCLLMNAVDAGLLTSIREGSPQFIKELLACHRPLVSTRVGDVSEIIRDVEGCFLADSDPSDIASKLRLAMSVPAVSPNESFKSTYDNNEISKRLLAIYQSNIKTKKKCVE